LPMVAEGAQAKVIGKVTKSTDYILRNQGKIVCNVPSKVLTKGIKYERERKELKRFFKEPSLREPDDYNRAALKVLSNPNVASKAMIYKHYDTEVQGLAVIRPGEADAGLQAPIPGHKEGVALTVDHNPKYSRINPYLGGVAAAIPYGMTDCLNFGNPEVPEAFNDFVESVKGIADAATKICWKGDGKSPVPFVSGNVSFYNESVKGKQIDPSPIISCVGYIEDYTNAITMKLKRIGSYLFLVGERKDELGGSAYYEVNDQIGANLPKIDFEKEKNMIYTIIDCIEDGLLLSCHDISDGGMLTTISEMILGGEADGRIGAEINLDFSNLRADKILFSESSGFIFEVDERDINEVKDIFEKCNLKIIELGKTIGDDSLKISKNNKEMIKLKIDELRKAWTTGVVEAMK